MEGCGADVSEGRTAVHGGVGLQKKPTVKRRLGIRYCLNSGQVAFHPPPPRYVAPPAQSLSEGIA